MVASGADAGASPGVRRRQLLGGGLAAVSLAGCDLFSTRPSGREHGAGGSKRGAGGDKGRESPMLADLVKRGDLPPVEERLPDTPMVVKPTKGTGSYGGTWHTALLGSADTSWLGRTIGYEYLMRWNPPWTASIPNVAESVDASADGRQFTITLPKGLRWSDGKPMTADDLMFAWNDVLGNTAIMPVRPPFMVSGDEPGEMTKLDERTVRIDFAKPSGLFTALLAFTGGPIVQYPRHYLKDFHLTYNPDAKEVAEKANVAGWADLLLAKADLWGNKDLPRLHGWVITTELGASNRVVAERNPYYFKTDPDGSQLPYIDKVIFDVIEDNEVILLKATSGEIDFSTRHFNSPSNKPVLARSRDKGGYHFISDKSTYENEMIINLNLCHKDPTLRAIFRNKEFRIGLSHAINRAELIKTVYQAQAKPWQAAPRPESEFYDEELAHQYLEYSTDLANQHLDQAGYDRRDAGRFRLGPDGNRIRFSVEVANAGVADFWIDGMQLVVKYWKEVGIEAQVRSEDRSIFYAHHAANKQDSSVWTGFAGGNTFGMMLGPRGYLPMSTGGSRFGIPWAAWYESQGKAGERPPAAPLEQIRLYRELLQTPDADKRKDLFRRILQIYKEQFYTIGTLMATSGYGIVKDNFHNVPESMTEDAWYNTPAPTNPEQYYIA